LLAVCKNEGGRPGPFYHMDDISVYLGRRVEGSPIKSWNMRPYLVVSVPSAGALNNREVKNIPLLAQNEESAKCIPSNRDPSPPSLYLGRH